MAAVSASYDEVMLDWAIAELLSPTWRTAWGDPYSEMWRDKISRGGIDALSDDDKGALVRAICGFRAPLIVRFGPQPFWVFRKRKVLRAEFEAFTTINLGDPPETFGQLARDARTQAQASMVSGIEAIRKKLLTGEHWHGTPIAVSTDTYPRPRLIEGYKRLIATFWSNAPAAEIYFGAPSFDLL